MSATAWGVVGATVGPLLLFLTYLLSRPQVKASQSADQMSSLNNAALHTTEIMRGLLVPMEKEISDLRIEVATLRSHIETLERMIRDQGIDPPPFPFV